MKKLKNNWEYERVVDYNLSFYEHERHDIVLSIARGLACVPSNVAIDNSEWFLLKSSDAGICLYKRQSNGHCSEFPLSGHLPINFVEAVDSKWYQAEQLDENIHRSISVILNEKKFFRLSHRVLFDSSERGVHEAVLDLVTY